MNAIFEQGTDRFVQVTNEPVSVGGTLIVNGKYIIPTPEGAAVDFGPTDNPTVAALKAASAFLVRYPMYENATYNFFLNATDMDGIDTGVTVPGPVGVTKPRYFMGRGGVGPAPTGAAVNSVGVLPANNYATISDPGLLVTETIDISGTAPAGTDEVLIWWYIATFATSENRVMTYTDQEPAGLTVYVSNDDGANWTSADRLLPVNLGAAGTDLRLAFINTGSEKLYVLGYVILYSEV